MAGRTRLVLSPNGTGLVVTMDIGRVQEALNLAKRGSGEPFVPFDRADGRRVHVAADKVLYVEEEA
jgi:hypothetical protein